MIEETGEIPELAMAQKLEMTRQALMPGVGTGDSFLRPTEIPDQFSRQSEPFMASTDWQGDGAHMTEEADEPSEDPRPSTTQNISFELKRVPGASAAWKVDEWHSTITVSTTGDSLTITGLGDSKTEEGYVVVKVETDPYGAIVGAIIAIMAVYEEFEFNPTDPSEQSYANLLIGKVTLEDGIYVFSQAIDSAQMISQCFENGTLVWGFIPYAVHPDVL